MLLKHLKLVATIQNPVSTVLIVFSFSTVIVSDSLYAVVVNTGFYATENTLELGDDPAGQLQWLNVLMLLPKFANFLGYPRQNALRIYPCHDNWPHTSWRK